MRCQIPAANLIRYIPDETQQDFKVPPGMELSIRSSQSSLKKKVAAAIQDCQTGSTAKRKGKREWINASSGLSLNALTHLI